MSEKYAGIKFNYIENQRVLLNHPYIMELKHWCKVFNEKNFAPPYPGGSSGNLSFRTCSNKNSFIITCSHTALNESMHDSDFSEVMQCLAETGTVAANGTKAPSSESFMHYLIYKNFKEINAVFHGHSIEIMNKAVQLGYPETEKEIEYGTLEFAYCAVDLIFKNNFVILKNHGFVSTGSSMAEAGKKIFNIIDL